jgi:hypothetical protein
MTSPDRRKLCKLQTSSKGKQDIVYIVYANGDEQKKIPRRHGREDFAGIFEKRDDAYRVAECLTNIFSKLHDEQWQLYGEYKVQTVYFNKIGIYTPSAESRYSVVATYLTRQPVSHCRIQIIYALSHTEQEAQTFLNEIQEIDKDYNDFRIMKYRMNDIMPTMFLDDYDKSKHSKKFKHVMNALKDIPRSQHSRREFRRGVRESKNISYYDSSDSEDDARPVRRPVTNRSLVHTPT